MINLLGRRRTAITLLDPDDPEDASKWLRDRRVRIRATFKPGDGADPLSDWFSRTADEVLDEEPMSRATKTNQKSPLPCVRCGRTVVGMMLWSKPNQPMGHTPFGCAAMAYNGRVASDIEQIRSWAS